MASPASASIIPLSRPFAFVRFLFAPDRQALLLSLLGVLVSFLVADRVFERMPHIEDEVAYVWQARVYAQGQMTIPTPPHPKSYLVPFVVDLHEQRFGKYPPGWPALLAVAVRLGLRAWLNPLLAGLGVWLTYRLGRRFFSPQVGLLAAGLTLSSPFFLMNSGSLLSHPLGMVLAAAFALAWLELFAPPAGSAPVGYAPVGEATVGARYIVPLLKIAPLPWILLAGGSLGLLVLTRPFTALAVAVPFGLHGLVLLARGASGKSPADRVNLRRALAVGLIALACAGLYLGWQKLVTGDWLKNPYELWWPYDKIGFGKGYGILERGHNWKQALYNTRRSLVSGAYDLFGWGALSWIFIPYGLWAATFGEKLRFAKRAAPAGVQPVLPRRKTTLWRGPRNFQAWMLFGMALSLVVAYLAYWIGSELYGPRYYYEGLFNMTLLSGAGIAFLAGWRVNPNERDHAELGRHVGLPLRRARAVGVMLVVAGLVGYNLAVYLPGRLQEMHGLYGANRGILRDFLNARVTEAGLGDAVAPGRNVGLPLQLPALVIVYSDTWHFYGALLELEDPFLTTPVIFAWSQHPTTDAVLHNDFPDRTVYHYYPDTPGVLYRTARDNP